MKKNTGSLSGFMLGFAATLLLGAVVAFVLTSLYRMENTISPEGYTVLSIEKISENEIEVLALNQKCFFDFDKASENLVNLSTYDVLIPSEIRTFFGVVKTVIGEAGAWVKALFF